MQSNHLMVVRDMHSNNCQAYKRRYEMTGGHRIIIE